MITSLQQRKKIVEKLKQLQLQLDAAAKAGVPENALALSNAHINESISLLQADIDSYDAACSANLRMLEFNSYEELYKLPIIIRLASKMSLSDFSKVTGISERQISLYESDDYRNAPSYILDIILKALKFNLKGYARSSA